MPRPEAAIIRDTDGAVGTLLPGQPETAAAVEVRLGSGRALRLPRRLLKPLPEGGFLLEGTFEAVAAEEAVEEAHLIPVVEEEARVRKETHETGRVRVTKRVEHKTETVEVPLMRDEVEVRRVPVGRVIEQPPEVRVEGDLTIVPVVEEQLVLQKRLVLKEEIHLVRSRTEAHEPQEVTLRREAAEIDRLPPDAPP